VTNLGVDLVKISVKPTTLQKMRTQALIKIGNPNWAEHRVVFSAVARAAMLYHAPLVAWGEDIGEEYGGTVVQNDGSAEDLVDNDLFTEATLEDLVGGDIPEREIFFYLHPDKAQLERQGMRSFYISHYYWWDGLKHYQQAREWGFRPRAAGPLSGNVLDYDNIDEKLCEIHIWFKFLKMGFWRPTDGCCYQIWNGRMTREEAVEIVNAKQYEFPGEYYKEFLEYHSLSEDQFWACVDRWRNPAIWHQVNGQWRLKVPLV
jgi:hypothetical protein